MSAKAKATIVWHRLLWAPASVAPVAAVLYLFGVIGTGGVGLVCSASWAAWWIAVAVLGWRSRSGGFPLPKSIGYSLLIGVACSYGVMWGVTLSE